MNTSEWRYAHADDPALAFSVFLAHERDHEYQIDHLDDRFVIRTNWQAANFRIMEAPIGRTMDRAAWRTLVGHRDDTFVQDFEVFERFLALSVRSGGLSQDQHPTVDGGRRPTAMIGYPDHLTVLRHECSLTPKFAPFRVGSWLIGSETTTQQHPGFFLCLLPALQRFGALGGQLGASTPNCLAYSAFSRCQPSNFMASPPAMRPMGVPLRRRSRTSKQMCHPAAPHGDEAAIDVVPQRQARAAARGFEFPPDIAVLKQPGSVGSRHCCFGTAAWAFPPR